MADLAKKHIDKLEELKSNVEDAREYFKGNCDRFNKFTEFVFSTSISDAEAGILNEINKPRIEFNILESYVSKLRGEFARQQPSLQVRAADGVPLAQLNEQFTETLKVIESHLRSIFFDGANDMLEYKVYSDLLAGGFSVMRVYTEYVSSKSFEQRICTDRVFDPTLCGFDPMARKSHMGDGRYCFEIYPMTKDQYIDEFGKDGIDTMKFSKDLGGFGWSYKSDKEDVVLVCDYFEKKSKKAKIVKLSNGHVVTVDEYKEFLEEWSKREFIEQPPVPVGKPRMTNFETIVRYRFSENKMLDYKETDYTMLPLVFIDGNSVVINKSGYSQLMTRPYIYHCEGIQQLKNYSGQALASELLTTVQHKFIVAIESIPENYTEAYKNVQKADTLLYTHFYDKLNPEIILPPPREVNRTPIPPQIADTFRMSDEITTAILGSFQDADIKNGNLSGVAVARTAMMSNNASVPFLVGYIRGLNRVADIIVQLIPKYYRTPRSLPTMTSAGKREYVEINKQGSLYMNYDPDSLLVQVEVGTNFQMQKEIALQTVTTLMGTSPLFADFMNAHGLQILLDNIDIRGIEELQEKAQEFEQQQQQNMQQQQQIQQQAMQVQQQQTQIQMQGAQMDLAIKQKDLQAPSPNEIGAMAVQEKAVTDAANVAIKERDSESKFLEVLAKIGHGDVDRELEAAKISAEHERSAVELAISVASHKHEVSQANTGKQRQDQ